MTAESNYLNQILKFILYLFPVFIILGNALINLSLVVICLIYFFKCFYQKKIIFSESFEFKIFLCFYLYLLFNSLLAKDIEISLLRTIPYFKFFVFILVYKDFLENKRINKKKLGLVWFITIGLLSFDIIYQSIFGNNIFNYVSYIENRNSGFFMDELVAGGFLLSFVYIIYTLIFSNQNKLYLFSYFFFFLIIIFLTGERSNFLKFIFIFFCIYLFLLKDSVLLKTIKISLIFLFLAILLNFSENLKSRYLSNITYSSNQNLNLIDSYLTSEYGSHTISSYLIFKENTLFGVGTKNFRKECSNYTDKVNKILRNIDENKGRIYPNGCGSHPHQIYNEILSEHGLFGLIVLIFIFLKLFLRNMHSSYQFNINSVCLIYLITYFIPILPNGSFFSTLTSTFFWMNYLFYTVNLKKNDQ